MKALAWLSLTLLIAAGGKPTFAHSWYPWECCSSTDCWPMGTDADAREPEPRIVAGGYLTHDGVFVAQRDTRPSRDGRFHVCRRSGSLTGDVIMPAQKQVCLFVPQPTF